MLRDFDVSRHKLRNISDLDLALMGSELLLCGFNVLRHKLRNISDLELVTIWWMATGE